MGLFDFLKKDEKKEEPAKKQEPVNNELYVIKVDTDQIPYHDPGVNMDVKLLVRTEFQFKGSKPDENMVNEVGVQCIAEAFSKVSGEIPVSEFSKSVNINKMKSLTVESAKAHGLDIYYVYINWISFNDEYREIINNL